MQHRKTMDWGHRIILVILAAFAMSMPATAQDYPKMKLRMGHYLPASTTQGQIDKWWAEEVEKRSGGKIKIEIFWAESLGKAKDLLPLISSGAIDLAATAQSYYPSELPLFGAMNAVPLGFGSAKEALDAQLEAVKLPAIQSELKKANAYPIYFHSLELYYLMCKKPIRNMADFKGAKMRSFGQYVPLMWASLGAVSVNLVPSEIYEALDRGTVDCAFFSIPSHYDYKFYEVGKYLMSHHFGTVSGWPVWASWEKWHSWPESVRKLLTDVGNEAMAMEGKQAAEASAKSLETMVSKHGVQVVPFQDWGKVVSTAPNLQDVWAKRMQQQGLAEGAQQELGLWRKKATPMANWKFPLARP